MLHTQWARILRESWQAKHGAPTWEKLHAASVRDGLPALREFEDAHADMILPNGAAFRAETQRARTLWVCWHMMPGARIHVMDDYGNLALSHAGKLNMFFDQSH